MAKRLSDGHIAELVEVMRVSTLQTANFKKIGPSPEERRYPTNEEEADRFVKERIRTWARSWIHDPIKIILEEIGATGEELTKNGYNPYRDPTGQDAHEDFD